jgi:hypothetical protein
MLGFPIRGLKRRREEPPETPFNRTLREVVDTAPRNAACSAPEMYDSVKIDAGFDKEAGSAFALLVAGVVMATHLARDCALTHVELVHESSTETHVRVALTFASREEILVSVSKMVALLIDTSNPRLRFVDAWAKSVPYASTFGRGNAVTVCVVAEAPDDVFEKD